MSRLPTGRVIVAHLRSGRAPALILALLVLVTTGLLAAVPGTLDRIGGAELRYQVARLSPNLRFLTARLITDPPLGPAPVGVQSQLPEDAETLWGAMDAGLSSIRSRTPEPLRDQLGRARYTTYTGAIDLSQPPPGSGAIGEFKLVLATDPRLGESTRLVSGSWPAPATSDAKPIGVALSVATARRMGWKVGEQRTPVSVPVSRIRILLTGTFDAGQGSEDFWTLNPSILLPKEQLTPNRDIITGTAFVRPGDWSAASTVIGLGGDSYQRVYYPFDVHGVRVSEIDQLRAQLELFTNGPHSLGLPPAGPDTTSAIRLTSSSPETLAAVMAGVQSADAVLSVLAVGPCGAALALLFLGCRLLAARRRRAFVLLSSRGADGGLLRSAFALEGLLLSIPAAVVGVGCAFLLLPPDRAGPALVLPVIAAALPAVVLAGSLSGGYSARPELAGVAASRARWIAEVVVLALAAASTVLLYRSDVGSAPGLDPLVAGTPLLLCLGVCLLLIRVLPVPLSALNHLFGRRSGSVNFLGSARSLRDRSALAPVLALVLGVSMAVLAAVLLSTLRNGVTTASRAEVGADLQIESWGLVQADVNAVARIPGVERVATSSTLEAVQLRVNGIEQGVQVYLVDSAVLGRVQEGIDGAVPLPANLGTADGRGVPVVVSADLRGSKLSADGSALRAVGSANSTSGLGRAATWVLADRKYQATFTIGDTFPEAVFVQLTPAANPSEVERRITVVLPDAVIQDQAARSSVLLAAPVVGGLPVVMALALALMAVLCAAAVLMTTVANAPARRSLVAVLRILGLPARSVRRLVGWELGPVAVAAVLGGTVTGLALCVLVSQVIDLQPFTGGRRQPTVVVDLPLLAVLLGGFVLVVTVAIVVSGRVAARASLANTLRFSDR